MGINLNHKQDRSITKIQKNYYTPKSVRLTDHDLLLLEEAKKRVKIITESYHCSDSQMFKMLLRLTKYVSDLKLKKALGDLL